MRLRCPHANCLIEVSDELVGTRIRCPHCSFSFIVAAKDAEPHADQFKVGDPAPKSKEAPNLENQIYDGLPPLAVMIALKRQQGEAYDAYDFASKFEMTEDDWKALDAFEFVLRASYQLRTALVLGLAGAAMNLAVVAGMLAFLQDGNPGPYASARTLGNLGSVVLLAAGLVSTWSGAQSFYRLRAHGLAAALPWLAATVAVVLGGSASVNLLTLGPTLNGRVAMLMMASAGFSVLAAFAALSACWRVISAQVRVRPPEIHNRLIEALKYLPD